MALKVRYVCLLPLQVLTLQSYLSTLRHQNSRIILSNILLHVPVVGNYILTLPTHAHPFTTSHYYPMEALNIDFIGPFLDKGYVMTIIDTFTRWVELHHSLAANVKSVANIYSNILEDLEPLLSLYQTGGHTLLTK